MGAEIVIESGATSVKARLGDSEAAGKVAESLPISAQASTWGDEIYFTIPISAGLDDTAKEVVELGDIGFWPPGSAMCLFFGPTPMSSGDEIRPASAVNIIGKILGDPKVLKSVSSGDTITISLDE